MDGLIKQAKALEAGVKSLTRGTKSQELLSILDQFHNALSKPSLAKDDAAKGDSDAETSSTDVKSEKQIIVGLLAHDKRDKELGISPGASPHFKEEDDELISEYKVDSLSDSGETFPYIASESKSEDMRCILCELEIGSTTDGALSTLPSDQMSCSSAALNVASLPSADTCSLLMAKFTFPSWKEFSQHIKEVHCGLDESWIENDGLTLKEGRIVSSSGKRLKSTKTRLILKYSILKCPRCKTLISATSSYKYGFLKLCHHLNMKHSIKLPTYVHIHQCKECSYGSHSEMLLARHEEYNHSGHKNKNNQKVTCTVCGKNILQRFLARHMGIIHQLPSQTKSSYKKIKCTICFKELSGRSNLESHIQRVHKQVRDFLCHVCSSSFHENKALVHHLYVKHGLNTQNKTVRHCQEAGCDFTTLTDHGMYRHNIAEHVVDKQFVCLHCGKSFKTLHNLRQHEKIMHPLWSENYQCDQCNFKSHSEQYLKRHMKIHSDVKKHKCSHCDYRSHFSENVKKHSKIHAENHVSKLKAKLDHSYTKRTRRSKSRTDDSSGQLPMGNHLAEVNTEHRMESLPPPETYNNYHGSNYYPVIQLPVYQTMPVPPTSVNHSLKPLLLQANPKNVDQATPGQDMLTLTNLSGSSTHPAYHCEQQFDSCQLGSNRQYMSL